MIEKTIGKQEVLEFNSDPFPLLKGQGMPLLICFPGIAILRAHGGCFSSASGDVTNRSGVTSLTMPFTN